MRRLLFAVAVACSAFLACRSPERRSPPTALSARPPAPAASPSVERKSPELAPLSDASWLERLEAEGGSASYVAVPLGAREPRPILVAIHGGGDRPDWACGGWRIAAEAFPFVVCPQGGKSGGDRFAWRSADEISRAIDAALAALRARFKGYVAEGPMIYAGFSQGATLAEPVLLARAPQFPVAVLAEGGYRTLADPEFSRRYAERGGLRLMIVCGGRGCQSHAARNAARLRSGGIEVLLSGDVRSGHNLNEPMQRALRASWPALVEGRPNWQAYARYRWKD